MQCRKVPVYSNGTSGGVTHSLQVISRIKRLWGELPETDLQFDCFLFLGMTISDPGPFQSLSSYRTVVVEHSTKFWVTNGAAELVEKYVTPHTHDSILFSLDLVEQLKRMNVEHADARGARRMMIYNRKVRK